MGKPNIVEVVGQYISLRRAGKEYIACCPFHEDKHPSFSINEEEGVFYCFGCGATGDVFDFLMRWSGKNFREVKDHYGIEIERKSFSQAVSDTTRAAKVMAEWAKEFSLQVAEKMRDIGQDLEIAKIADDREILEILEREWEILEVLHDDLNDPQEIVSLYESRDDLERLVDR